MRRKRMCLKQKAGFCVSVFALFFALPCSTALPTGAAEEAQENASKYSKWEPGSFDFYILPYSDVVVLPYVSADLSTEDIRLAKNEIYARHGRRFKDPQLQEYFELMSWYEGTIEPEDFDESLLNEKERQNVAILDAAYQNGTGEGKESAVDRLLAMLEGTQEFLPAEVVQDQMVETFYEAVSVSIAKDARVEDPGEDRPFGFLSEFYSRDQQIYGNIGFDKSIYSMHEGEPCAWYQGKEYVEKFIDSSEVSSEDELPKGASGSVIDTFALYEDGRKIAETKQADWHDSGTRSSIYWLLSDEGIYVNEFTTTVLLGYDGNKIAENAEGRFPFALDDNYVYAFGYDNTLVRMDRETLENTQVLVSSVWSLAPERAGTDFLLYQNAEGCWRYEYNTGESNFVGDPGWWTEYAVQGGTIYAADSESSFHRSVIRRLKPGAQEWETVCCIEGDAALSLTGVQGNMIYVELHTFVDWQSDGGPLNSISAAIDLEHGTVHVLGGGWYS